MSGNSQEYEPNFTFHGFRYVHLENFPENIRPEDFTGVVLYSGMEQTGTFSTSNPLLNQLQHNIVWGQKGNFLDVPTDCPQRDERLGWTADAQIFFPTASFNMNVYNFFRKWLKDLRYAQLRNGAVPFVVPDVLKGAFGDSNTKTTAGWGDAVTIIPWEMYKRYGNIEILEENYTSMKRWVDYIRGQGNHETLWNTGLQLGDWLALDTGEESFFGATDETLVATCYFAYSTYILFHTAKKLGNYQDYVDYQQLYYIIKNKIEESYFENNRLKSDTQTAHIIVLLFNLYPSQSKENLIKRLIELIDLKGGHLDTGFIGSPYICQVLSDNGHVDVAYDLLLKEEFPSWLYQVKNGATTVWEHWDGIKDDGTFWDEGMNSFNHYVYGAIGAWMYETIGGIKLKTPGYQDFIVAPKLDSRLEQCTTSLETGYGRIISSWKIENKIIDISIKVPANTTAEIVLPNVLDKSLVNDFITTNWFPIRMNEKESSVQDIGFAAFEKHTEETTSFEVTSSDVWVALGSGNYKITYELSDWEEK